MTRTPIHMAKRIEGWQKKLASLGVAHFEFELFLLEETPGGPNASATAQASRHYDKVVFTFRNDYVEEATDAELDQTIIHEWVHVAMRDLDHVLETPETWMPLQTYTDWEAAVDHEREGLVERLSVALHQFHEGNKPRFSP